MKSEIQNPKSKIRIMIVEDEIIVARDIKSSLEALGYYVSSIVDSGEMAIQDAKKNKPDLVLMDIVLQGPMDGIEAAGQIYSIFNIPVIYLTSYTNEEIIDRAKMTAPFGYIVKPFEDKELRSNIEMAFYKHKLEKKLKESEEKFFAITSAAMDAIILMDNSGDVSYWNPAAERIFGYSCREAVGSKLLSLIVPQNANKAFKEGFDQFRRTGSGTIIGKTLEMTAVNKEGEVFPVEMSISAIKIKGLWHSVGVVRDITEHVKLREELRTMSVTDDLTKLHNRRGFFTLAEQQLKIANREKKELCLFFADLDGLKIINDTHGHHSGDAAIVETAHILRETFRDSDIVARLSGDEFVVLVTELFGPTEDIIKRLKKKIAVRNDIKNQRFLLSLSTGMVQYDPGNSCSIDELLAKADALMYEHKQRRHRS